MIIIFKSKTNIRFTVKLIFQITQHTRDEELLKSFIEYFDCGRYSPRSNQDVGDFNATRFSDVTNKIIPFLKKYPIVGVKALDFADFSKVAEIMQARGHLTEKGLEEIRLIKAGMNRGRK